MTFFQKLLSDQQFKSIIGVYLSLSFIGCLMVLYRIFITLEIDYLYLIWNLFLAWIPFGLSVLIRSIYFKNTGSKKRNIAILLAGVVWFFFYPNAPYMITDFIHFRGIKFYLYKDGRFAGFNDDFIVWYDFVMNSIFILTGFLLGFLSLYLLQRVIFVKIGKVSSWGFVCGVLLFSSFGIYLGRFIRWNTWDIVSNPVSLMKSVMESLHLQALSFTFLFSFFLLLIYIALYQLTYLNLLKDKSWSE